MPTPRIDPDRTLTGAERQRRHKVAQRLRAERMESTLRDLLAAAERGTIGAKYVAQKCREALFAAL
jgi:hypothetical protein